MPNSVHDPNLDDRARRVQFVEDVRLLLEDILKRDGKDHKGRQLLVAGLVKPLKDAWPDMKPYFDLAAEKIRNAPADAVTRHGLLGSVFAAKLSVVRYLWDNYLARGGGRLFIRLLDSIDSVLESLLDAAGV